MEEKMKEQRSVSRIDNSALPTQLCRASILLAGGNEITARTINLSETGMRILVSSDECGKNALAKGRSMHVVFPEAEIELSGECIYSEERKRAVAFLGIGFVNPYERILFGRYLNSILHRDEAV
jgi:hypothetical protein